MPGVNLQLAGGPSRQLQPAMRPTESMGVNNAPPPISTIGTEARHDSDLLPPILLQSSGVAEAPLGRNDNRARQLHAEAQRPRRRLIDTLTAQKADSESESETLSSPGSATEDDSAPRVSGSPCAPFSSRFRLFRSMALQDHYPEAARV